MVADQLARLRLDEGAAAGGDDALALADQPRQHPPFAVAEIGFAMRGENFGDGHAMGGFDLVVGIDEGEAEPLREPPADRRLARAHHADEDQRPSGQTVDDRLRARVARRRRRRLRLVNDGLIRHNRHVLSRRARKL